MSNNDVGQGSDTNLNSLHAEYLWCQAAVCHTSTSLHASLLCCQDFALSTLPFFPLLSFEVPGLLPARPAAPAPSAASCPLLAACCSLCVARLCLALCRCLHTACRSCLVAGALAHWQYAKYSKYLACIEVCAPGDVATAVSAGAASSARQVRATCSVQLAASSGQQAGAGAGRGGQQGGKCWGGTRAAAKFAQILASQFSEFILVQICTINCLLLHICSPRSPAILSRRRTSFAEARSPMRKERAPRNTPKREK
jgi:hypothetical protein